MSENAKPRQEVPHVTSQRVSPIYKHTIGVVFHNQKSNIVARGYCAGLFAYIERYTETSLRYSKPCHRPTIHIKYNTQGK